MGDDNVVQLKQPAEFVADALTDLLKTGARQLIAEAIKKELAELLETHKENCLEDGRQAVIRNDYLPERDVQTGIGPVKIQLPKVRDMGSSSTQNLSHLT